MNWLAVWCQVAIGAGTVGVLWGTHRLAKQSKRADVLMECNRRFDRLWEIRCDRTAEVDAAQYWLRFWNLQLNQFTHWRQRFVEDREFRFWMECRHDEWHKDRDFKGMKYQEGFNQLTGANRWPREFVQFMKTVHEHSVDEALQALKKHRL